MIFESLSEKLQNSLNKLRGKGKITEKDLKEAMREVKLALLEADVNFKVVKEFIQTVTERSLNADVMESLTPGQQVIKIVHDELKLLMGDSAKGIQFSPNPPTIIMLCGLQGAGKTTMAGKLALQIKKKGHFPLLVACDIYRPAAIKQLEVVGQKVGVPVFQMGTQIPAEQIAKSGLEHARKNGNDVVIVDTAGRLHIDDDLMEELKRVKAEIIPHEILLVLDAMTGQDAVNVAEHFDQSLDIQGVVLTKLDGDARGGAALSIRAVTHKPIKYIGLGEKAEDFELFHPDRLASRILGMGDVLTLIEKAQAQIDEKKALELEQKLRKQSFTLEDFLDQLEQVKKMGPLNQLLEMIPGMNKKALQGVEVNEKDLGHVEAIIRSMTKKERLDPSIMNASRRRRIAAGSGTSVQEVNRLLKQYEDMKKMMKQFSKMEKSMKRGKGGFPFQNFMK